MNQTHSTPEIYNPDIPTSVKCKIVEQLCCALAKHNGITVSQLRNDLKQKLHVDFKNLENNPIGMILLYEYLYSLRPSACSQADENQIH